VNDTGGVRITPLPLDASFAVDGAVAPPDLSAAGDVALVTFTAFARNGSDGGASARALLACFTAPLEHGFSEEEIAPLVLDRVRDVAVNKMHLTHIVNGAVSHESGGNILRRADGARANGADGANADGAGEIVSDLAFTADARVVACAAACTDRAACGAAVRSARFDGALGAPPGPGPSLAIALSAVHHPDAAIALGAAIALVASWLLVWRRPKSRS
jgi:hypothetical protein